MSYQWNKAWYTLFYWGGLTIFSTYVLETHEDGIIASIAIVIIILFCLAMTGLTIEYMVKLHFEEPELQEDILDENFNIEENEQSRKNN